MRGRSDGAAPHDGHPGPEVRSVADDDDERVMTEDPVVVVPGAEPPPGLLVLVRVDVADGEVVAVRVPLVLVARGP